MIPIAPNHVHLVVFDDVRELPHDMAYGFISEHCRTQDEFMEYLDRFEGGPVVAILDHDLGGEAFGEETARDGVKRLCRMHEDDELDVIQAVVVTMNPAGQKWIIGQLEQVGIDYDIDPGGRNIGMRAPQGW